MWAVSFIGLNLKLMTFKAKKEDNPEEALKEFRAIVDQETEKGDWLVSHHVSWWTLFIYEESCLQGIQGVKAVYKVTLPSSSSTN